MYRWRPGLVALLLCAALFGLPVAAVSAAPASGCTVLQVRSPSGGGQSTVAVLRLPGGSPERVARLPYQVDAVGYSDSQDLGYGIGRSGGGPAKVVVIDRYGRSRDLGVVKPAKGPAIPAATAGAISGARWYLGAAGSLYTVDIDPGNGSYLQVVRVQKLRPARFAAVDDFAVDPESGRLYGVVVSGQGDVIAVSIDPSSGRVRPEPQVQLPETSTVGSVVLGANRTLFASVQQDGRAGQWYEVVRSGGVRPVGAIAAGSASDAAGCLPPPTPTPPLAMMAPAPSPLAPILPPPHRQPPEERSPGSPPPPPMLGPKQPVPVAAEESDATAKKRRWSLVVLIMILGGAAMHRRR
jgi:hypothetical protein